MIQVIKDIFSVIGAITTIIGVIELYQKYYLGWRKRRAELKARNRLLDNTDYFIAHIIHMGGEFSMTYSMQVFSNEEGGYYFNPPKEFVHVSFNRSGDSMVVTMPDFVQRAGFVIDSTGDNYDNWNKSVYPGICHLPIGSLKNEYFVKFTKEKHK